MRTTASLLIMAISLLTTSVAAADFFCPQPSPLPQTLNLAPAGQGAQSHKLTQLQATLNNLMAIRQAYLAAPSNGARNTVANCLLDHLVTMADDKALLSPATRADGATWFLFVEETRAALNTLQPRHLRNKPEARYIQRWLNSTPAYGPPTPFAVSSR